jgi:hypothetical protein
VISELLGEPTKKLVSAEVVLANQYASDLQAMINNSPPGARMIPMSVEKLAGIRSTLQGLAAMLMIFHREIQSSGEHFRMITERLSPRDADEIAQLIKEANEKEV